jgi:hypothetical protein
MTFLLIQWLWDLSDRHVYMDRNASHRTHNAVVVTAAVRVATSTRMEFVVRLLPTDQRISDKLARALSYL